MNEDWYGGSKWYGNEYSDVNDLIKEFLVKNSKKYYGKTPIEKPKTKKEKVIEIAKGEFEAQFGMTIQEFQEIYEEIVEENPESLI